MKSLVGNLQLVWRLKPAPNSIDTRNQSMLQYSTYAHLTYAHLTLQEDIGRLYSLVEKSVTGQWASLTLTLLASRQFKYLHHAYGGRLGGRYIDDQSTRHHVILHTSSSDVESEAGKANGLDLTFLSNSLSSGVILTRKWWVRA